MSEWAYFGGGLEIVWSHEPELLTPLLQKIIDLQHMHLYEFVGDFNDIRPYLGNKDMTYHLTPLLFIEEDFDHLCYKPYTDTDEILHAPDAWTPMYFCTVSALALEYYHNNYNIDLGHMSSYEEDTGFVPSVGASRSLFLYSLGDLSSDITCKYFFSRQWKTNLPSEFYDMLKEIDIQYIRDQDALPSLDRCIRTPVALPNNWTQGTPDEILKNATLNPFNRTFVTVNALFNIQDTHRQHKRVMHDDFYKPQALENIRYFVQQGFKIYIDSRYLPVEFNQCIGNYNLFTKNPEEAAVVIRITPDDFTVSCSKMWAPDADFTKSMEFAHLATTSLALIYAFQGIALKNQNFEVILTPNFKHNEYEICNSIRT